MIKLKIEESDNTHYVDHIIKRNYKHYIFSASKKENWFKWIGREIYNIIINGYIQYKTRPRILEIENEFKVITTVVGYFNEKIITVEDEIELVRF